MGNNTIYVPPKYIKSSGPDLQQDGIDLDPIPLINFTDGFTINHEPQYPRYTLSVNNQFIQHQFASGALNTVLTTKTGSVNSDLIVTTGRTSANDGGGGTFYWVTAAYHDNNNIIIVINDKKVKKPKKDKP